MRKKQKPVILLSHLHRVASVHFTRRCGRTADSARSIRALTRERIAIVCRALIRVIAQSLALQQRLVTNPAPAACVRAEIFLAHVRTTLIKKPKRQQQDTLVSRKTRGKKINSRIIRTDQLTRIVPSACCKSSWCKGSMGHKSA